MVTRARSLCLVLALVVGCASPMSKLRDDNRRLNQDVSDLREERRAQDRKMRDIQHQLDEARGKIATGALADAPPLPVEVAGPATPAAAASGDRARVVGIADDGTEIVYEGAAIGARTITVDAEPSVSPSPVHVSSHASAPMPDIPASADRIEVTRHVPPLAAQRTRSKTRDHDPPSDRAGSGDAANDYRLAVELVKAGKHEDAIAALRMFLSKYPKHDYADNAQYWIGEAYYAQKDYPHALYEFRTVVERYPRGNKVPDAMLKVGYCFQALGQADKAHAMLEQVVTLYPKTEPAALAAKRLETP